MATPEEDADKIKEAMKGIGTDEDAIIDIIVNRTNAHRLEISRIFEEKYGNNIIDELKSELNGYLEDAVIALFLSPLDYDVSQLNKAMKGAGTDEDTLIEIICSRPTDYIQKLKLKYKEIYGKSLEKDVEDDTSGEFQYLLLELLKCERAENEIPNHKASYAKAKELVDEGQDNWSKKNSKFNQVFVKCSPMEIVMIAKYYHKLTGKTIIETINEQFSDDIKETYKAILYAMVSPSEFFATKVRKAVEGWGTKDNLLIRILVSRDEIDMPNIKRYYKQLYKSDLVEDVKADTSGDYQKLLIKLIEK